jgi:hypothetical protein
MTDVRVPGAFASVLACGFEDEMAVEEPLEIRVDGQPIARDHHPYAGRGRGAGARGSCSAGV